MNRRMLGLLGAALTLWFLRAEFLPASNADAARQRPSGPKPSARAAADGDVCTVPAQLPERSAFAAFSKEDPFLGPRPPAAAAPAPVPEFAGPPLRPPPPAPAPPPRLPYKLVGVMREKDQTASVFLTHEDRLIQARAGDTLDGGYRLLSIAMRELTFLNLQQNLTVRMPVDGEPS